MNETRIRELWGETPRAVEFSYEEDGYGRNQRKALKAMLRYMEAHGVSFWSAYTSVDPYDDCRVLITAVFHTDPNSV